MLPCRLHLAAELCWGFCTVSPDTFIGATKNTSQGAKERVQGTHSSYDWGGSLKSGG